MPDGRPDRQAANSEQRKEFGSNSRRLAASEDIELDFSKLPDSGLEYTAVLDEGIPTHIHFDNGASEEFTVLDVESADHVGLLYALSKTLTTLGMVIVLARINTEKGGANDSFYLTDEDGGKIEEPARQQFIESTLRNVITALHEA